MQTVIDATQKETAIDQQQHSCETLICQRHQTILRILSSAATASTRWPVRELNCPTTYMKQNIFIKNQQFSLSNYIYIYIYCVGENNWFLIKTNFSVFMPYPVPNVRLIIFKKKQTLVFQVTEDKRNSI